MSKPLNDQGRRAQAECLAAKGYPGDAAAVARGDVDYDADALEALDPNDGTGVWKAGGRPV